MNKVSNGLTFLLRRLVFFALPAALVSPSQASTIRVPADHSTIFDAIQFAQNGDTILVSPGIYPEQVDFLGKDIVIRSTNGPETTILDGQGQYTVVKFVMGEGPTARIDGFTIRNGLGTQQYEAGGIWCHQSEPTIVNCIVTSNQGRDNLGRAASGGIGSDDASPTIEGCVIEYNVGGRAGGDGPSGAGGIGVERAGIAGTTGSGIVLRNCLVRFNRGGDLLDFGNAGAGGVYVGFAVATMEDCTIISNVGGHAPPGSPGGNAGVGGMRCKSSAVDLRRCRILSNQAGDDQTPGDGTGDGGEGGIAFQDRIPTSPTLAQAMVNCVVAWNRGGQGGSTGGSGGVLVYSAWLDLTNCAIVGNVGGLGGAVGGIDVRGLSASYPSTITNTVFWLNGGQGGRPDSLDTWNGPDPIVSNLMMDPVDPEFVDLAANDFHLRCISPAIDAGTDTAPILPVTDIDGEPRLSGAQVDIGPDEFQDPAIFPTYCQPVANSSGVPALISASGCLSVAENELRVFVDGLPGTPGLLFYGPSQIQVSFGDGLRCVGGAVRRMPPMPGMGPSIAIDLDLSTLQVTGGVQSNFQYWFRDPMAGGAGFNLSDGLEANFIP